jgi:membrane protease YdiL (CAAX protease family)
MTAPPVPRIPESPGRADAPLTAGQQVTLALACLIAGFAPVAVGYIRGGVARLVCGLAITAALLALALLLRRSAVGRRYWELALAFFGMALFVLADRHVPGFLTGILGSPPVAGNPVASSVGGTVIVELDELLLTVVAVVVVLAISRRPPSSAYVRWGRFGRAYVIGIAALVLFYALSFGVLSHSRFLPVHGSIDFARFLSLTPALLTAAAANGFLEELMFRGLLMSRLNIAFRPLAATFLQAAVFASWHVGVTYTASALLFIILVAFPLGLVCGYLTRSSRSIVPSSLFHAGADLPIYLGFLSAVS